MHMNDCTTRKQNFQFSQRRAVYATAVQIRVQYFSQLKTVGRAETFESWPSEKGVNST